MHIQDPAQKQWLQDRMEATMNAWKLDDQVRHRVLNRLVQAEEFEHFLQTRFVGQKRFGLEGLESFIVALDEILERAANANVQRSRDRHGAPRALERAGERVRQVDGAGVFGI